MQSRERSGVEAPFGKAAAHPLREGVDHLGAKPWGKVQLHAPECLPTTFLPNYQARSKVMKMCGLIEPHRSCCSSLKLSSHHVCRIGSVILVAQ